MYKQKASADDSVNDYDYVAPTSLAAMNIGNNGMRTSIHNRVKD